MSSRNSRSSRLPAMGHWNNSQRRAARYRWIGVLAGLSAAVFAGSALAVPPSWLTLMPSVQAALLLHEQTFARTASGHPLVECHVVYSTAPIVECLTYTLTRRAGAKPITVGTETRWVSRLVEAVVDCKYARANVCHPTPVCSYRVSVSSGASLVAVSGAILNVCRPGWTKALR